MDYNKIVITGNLVKDPELRKVGDDRQVCSFRMASNSNNRTVYIDVDAWGPLGENIHKYKKKGHSILVEGNLRLDEWETPEGQKRSKHFIHAKEVLFTDRHDKS